MSFVEERLRDDIESGAEGGPGFKTTVTTLSSGHEQRNIDWEYDRGEWDLSYGIQTKNDYRVVLAFFRARRGRAIGFRFKDWADYRVFQTEQFAEGDGSTLKFQLYKWYGGFNTGYRRAIQKPVDGTFTIYVDDVEDTDATIDPATGVITFLSAPGNGDVISAAGEFDVPVRLALDRMSASIEWVDAASLPNIPIIELRQPFGSLV